MFEYLDENLNKLLQNIDSIMVLQLNNLTQKKVITLEFMQHLLMEQQHSLRVKSIKKGGIEYYLNYLRKNKQINYQHDSYEILDYYNTDDDILIIPKLQE